MKNIILILLGVVTMTVLTADQSQAQGKRRTITGTVVDTYCLVTMNMGGESHKKCAEACVRNGSPVAIKEDRTGTIYLAAGHQKNMTFAPSGLEKYLEERVTVDGTVYEKNGIRMIVVESAAPVK